MGDVLIFSGLIMLHVGLVVWVHKARPPLSVLEKYPTIPVLLSWLSHPSLPQVTKIPSEEMFVLRRYKQRVVVQF